MLTTTTSLLLAIAREEGWLDHNSRCRRNNNPGNIEYGKFAASHGATEGDGRFAVFPNEAAGFEAMRVLLSGPVYRGLTVAQAIGKWAPSNENDTARYVLNVCEWAGCAAADPLAAHLLAA